MSNAKRRRGRSLHLDLPKSFLDVPPVSALFLVLFDVKAGYTIAWKRSVSALELADSVEFKSLPSGLHHVREDLIYFIHDDKYAGISAFVNKPLESSERNAVMLAVGALVPIGQGRLGKSWQHAAELKRLAWKLVDDPSNTQPLEDFWNANQRQNEEQSSDSASPIASPVVDRVRRKQSKPSPSDQPHRRDRAVSSASALAFPSQSLSPYHPALSLPGFLETFGPLIFPLYKAALLRKRILFVGQAPVKATCDFVYIISVLSGIPTSISDSLPLDPLPSRIQCLFSVGIHDMPILAQGSRSDPRAIEMLDDDGMGYGWVACTTDGILATKPDLYDLLVSLPPSFSRQAREKAWPRIEVAKGLNNKATQRDLRRYQSLGTELQRFPKEDGVQLTSGTLPTSEQIQSQTPHFSAENMTETYDDASSTIDEKLIEPHSWAALVYSSFMWWASAGENRTDLDEEAEHDAALLRNPNDYYNGSPTRPKSASAKSPEAPAMEDPPVGLEMAVIAYFHRFTTLILGTLAQIIEASDGDEDGGGEQGSERDSVVFVSSEDVARMGLDIWSSSDRIFVEELIDFYWGRRAEVQGGEVECCGIRIC